MDGFSVQPLTGKKFLQHLSDAAAIRRSAFREFPYLLEDTQINEEEYLKSLALCPESLFILAKDGDKLVGCGHSLPLEFAPAVCQKPFREYGYDIGSIYYLGEALMLKPYRWQGFETQIFEEQEAFARGLRRFEIMTLCGIDREEDHPLRPEFYRPQEELWERHGFRRQGDLSMNHVWKDLDEDTPSDKFMTCWTKEISLKARESVVMAF
jgi:GNAT superfamily N-acetyltransferase